MKIISNKTRKKQLFEVAFMLSPSPRLPPPSLLFLNFLNVEQTSPGFEPLCFKVMLNFTEFQSLDEKKAKAIESFRKLMEKNNPIASFSFLCLTNINRYCFITLLNNLFSFLPQKPLSRVLINTSEGLLTNRQRERNKATEVGLRSEDSGRRG